MSYIGNTAQTQGFTPAIDYFSGNASTTAFTLSRPVASVAQVQAVIENVPQNPGDAFTVSGNTITFTSAPPSGTNNIYVYYTSPITTVVQPGQGTVGTAQIVDGAVTSAKLASGLATQWTTSGSDIYYNTGDVGIGTSSPTAPLTVYGARYDTMRVGRSNAASFAIGIPSGSPTDSLEFNGVQAGYDGYLFTGASGDKLRLTSAGLMQFNSGYGSVATAYGCRAWVNFNGTGTPAIRASGNVSSITDNSTGFFTVNYTSAMPDTNYCAVGGVQHHVGITANGTIAWEAPYSTTQLGVYVTSTSGSYDPTIACVAIFR